MKNPIKLCYNWILRLFRRKQFKKRQEVYDDVIEKLSEVVAKKKKEQSDLKIEILTYMRTKLGYDSDSKFIPKHGMNDAELKSKINIQFKFRMDQLNMRLTDDLKIICI